MSEIIPSDAVRAIQESVKTETVQVGAEIYTTRAVHLPPREPMPSTLKVHTLAALIEFTKIAREKVEAIHVVSPSEVHILGPLTGRHQDRPLYLAAEYDSPIDDHFFGRFHNPEAFIISLQAWFKPGGGQIAAVLRIVGNLKEEAVRNLADDGITQEVTVRAGVAMAGRGKVPNPVILAPYRTFPEVDQPESPFVLRAQSGKEGQPPTCGLFEADGGAWELAAIQNIHGFLSDRVEGVPILA
jgi:hypothetical protein